MEATLRELQLEKRRINRAINKIKYYLEGGKDTEKIYGEEKEYWMREEDKERAINTIAQLKDERELLEHLIDIKTEEAA